jgi:hypothetical protein
MIDYDIFWYNARFEDGTGEKIRPAVIIDKDAFYYKAIGLGVYSYKDWFNFENKFYEIQDWKEAGLTNKSQIKLSVFYDILLGEININEYIGHLSKNDISGLSKSLENYYN